MTRSSTIAPVKISVPLNSLRNLGWIVRIWFGTDRAGNSTPIGQFPVPRNVRVHVTGSPSPTCSGTIFDSKTNCPTAPLNPAGALVGRGSTWIETGAATASTSTEPGAVKKNDLPPAAVSMSSFCRIDGSSNSPAFGTIARVWNCNPWLPPGPICCPRSHASAVKFWTSHNGVVLTRPLRFPVITTR